MAELTAYDQLLLELVNRARLDPLAEASRLGINLNQGLAVGTLNGDARQVLAPNELLNSAASDHSLWMLDTDTFSHTGAGGSNPGDRMAAAGYVFAGSWTWGENIAWVGTTGAVNLAAFTAQIHDNLFESPGHRVNILGGSFREIGIGVETGQMTSGSTTYNAAMATQNFAASGSSVFVTGVAIADADHDDFYDIGEGRAGITVTVTTGSSTLATEVTAAAGGYAAAITAQPVTVTFSGGGLPSNVSVAVDGGSRNVKVDLVDDDRILTSADAVLGDGAMDLVLLGVAALDGTGNDLANTIIGNRGANVLRGLDGDDILRGAAGRDILSGGNGFDDFVFNSTGESRKGRARDTITDFEHGVDDIDLSSIDANTRAAGDQAFRWKGKAAFSGKPGELHFVRVNVAGTAGDKTIIEGDINGDRRADFQIELTGLKVLFADDFIL